jgi:hypothetical protein
LTKIAIRKGEIGVICTIFCIYFSSLLFFVYILAASVGNGKRSGFSMGQIIIIQENIHSGGKELKSHWTTGKEGRGGV